MQNNFLKDWICLYYIQLCSPKLITQKRQWKWIVCIATIVILLMYDNLENIRMIDLAMIAILVHVLYVQVSLYKKCKLPRDDRLHLKRKKTTVWSSQLRAMASCQINMKRPHHLLLIYVRTHPRTCVAVTCTVH